ncbi:MAG: hypothetical protein U5L96_11735 [Owenweeksia sp.]|nr:hypothetical protein [Owenweeksia sp.]
MGINASYLFGQVEDRDELTWGQGINNSVIEELVTVRGFKFNYGLQYSQAFANNNELSLGLTFSNSTGLNADLENYAYTTRGSGLSVDSISDLSSQKITLPTEFGVGLTYGQRLLPRDRNEWWALSKYRWSFSADLELYQGSEFTNYNGNTPLANGYKLSAGGFITPSLVPEEIKRNGSYFGKIEYRLGAFMK